MTIQDDNYLVYNAKIEALRAQEFPMLQSILSASFESLSLIVFCSDITYLDHAGTTLYSRSLMNEFSKDMMSNLLGNPHSASTSSQFSARRIENIRLRVLHLFNADPNEFDIVFVANATAGIKLVADAFREQPGGFWYGYHKDAHTSLVGVREVARLDSRCFESDEAVDSWLDSVINNQYNTATGEGCGLFAYPAQSNMNGRRLPLDWCSRIRALNVQCGHRLYSLLDAAALVSTCPLDLSNVSRAPDFTAMSFYKIFGFPDLGALIVRKASGGIFQCVKYFGGGTVEMVTCLQESRHIKKEHILHAQLEDGTLPIHNIIALDGAMNVHERLFGTLEQISKHTSYLTSRLYEGLKGLKHGNDASVCHIYEHSKSPYKTLSSQGATIALNLRDFWGAWVSITEVEKLAAIRNIHLRSGGLCNPGGVASSLGLNPWDIHRNFSAGQRCGNENDIMDGKPTGMLRLSLGAMSTLEDVRTFLEFIKEFFVEHREVTRRMPTQFPTTPSFYVETLMIYPIKSCGGWRIPPDVSWSIKPEGLALDREWCLVHQGSRAALSQKRYPKMALLRPTIDLNAKLLHIRYSDPSSLSCPSEITIPLFEDPSVFQCENVSGCTSRVCGDTIKAQIYSSTSVTSFFTDILGVPCYLTRFPPKGSGLFARHAKAHLLKQELRQRQRAITQSESGDNERPLATPILLSNESPILVISRSSLNRLNEIIKARSLTGKAASAQVFRSNIIIAEDTGSPPEIEQPYIEDSWQSITVYDHDSIHGVLQGTTVLDILGPCRRCQMVCVDQSTGEKNEEPFVTLARTRRVDGKVYFGMHAGLAGGEGSVKIGARVLETRRRDMVQLEEQ
ncbi:hypothetical protein MMC34_003562 [Xylographa carneopallida]|nr:hypothetical protein [Xylographa carneopallida]